MELTAFLPYLQSLPAYRGQIAHVEHLPARPPRYGRLDRPLHPALADALHRQGLRELYTHQAAAINAIRQGQHVVVSTSTASGKTLCYNLPVLETILAYPKARALYLFPTKALAQDQLRSLRELAGENIPTLRYGTFDGDTPQATRTILKKTANIILSNPDMISLGILPNHTSWKAFFANLKYVVIDEAHTYRGVFGSHVANVIRRLRRVCRLYRSNDGAPRGSRDFVFWNPPLLGSNGERRSANSEATLLFTELVRAGIRNITFTKSRKTAELIFLYAREVLSREAPDLVPRIASYRAGYRPEDRRQIERGLFQGHLLGVTATNALELGVDIGGLDATVLSI